MSFKTLARKYLLEQFNQLPGLPAKASQFLSMRFELDGQDHVCFDPVPIDEVWTLIQKGSPSLAADLDTIDSKAMMASLAQVHPAQLRSGKKVAIKIQYPGIQEDLKTQLKWMMRIFRGLPLKGRFGLDQESYEEFFHKLIHEELNYSLEAKTQEIFRAAWKSDPKVVIPEVLKEYSTSSVLVQSYEPSEGLRQLKSLEPHMRMVCARDLSLFFLKGLFKEGLIHADFHPKNWGYRSAKEELVLYDFGATLRLDPQMVQTLLKLLTQGQGSSERALELFCEIGFDPEKLACMGPMLSDLCGVLGEPLTRTEAWNPKTWTFKRRMEEVLQAEKWTFRTAGPPWFLLLMRSIYGWYHALCELDVSVPIGEMIEKEVELNLSQPRTSAPENRSNVSRFLKVKVIENEEETVYLEMPARAVENLDQIIPTQVLEVVKRQSIDLERIRLRALNSGLVPQLLFEASNPPRNYRVWIE